MAKVAETHQCYDAQQYPVISWDGADGYPLNAKMINPVSGKEINMKCSVMNYYSYRLMIQENEDNDLLKCRQLFHQHIHVCKSRKICLNWTKLRSEECVHLRDAVVDDGNATNVARLTILTSSYTGSSRHKHEYAQDAIEYVPHYGRPDLFITFTYNPFNYLTRMGHSNAWPGKANI